MRCGGKSAVSFTTPALLLGLLVLPLLWWLLRATPPAPRLQAFPAIRLLADLPPREETPARTPWWLLTLRLAAAGLVVIGLAGPVLDAEGTRLRARTPALLVIDDGWSAAADWADRQRAAQAALDPLERAGGKAALLTTAVPASGDPLRATAAMPVALLRRVIAALRPLPWPVDRLDAAAVLRTLPHGPVLYVADGLAAPGDDAFAAALGAFGPITEWRAALSGAAVLTARPTPDRLLAVLHVLPGPPRRAAVLAETADGRVLARVPLVLPAGTDGAAAAVPLPIELRNELGRLVLEGVPSAGSVALLDESARRHPVGLVASSAEAETPLLGPLFYLERALGPSAELRRGSLEDLLGRKLAVLILTDEQLVGRQAAAVDAWVRQGGLLIRFAGPLLATADGMQAAAPSFADNRAVGNAAGPWGSGEPADAAPLDGAPAPAAGANAAAAGDDAGGADGAAGPTDPLLPVPLLAGDRELGGAMSWSRPAHLAPFPDNSPFAGLPVPAEVTVNRQVLAEPSAGLAAHSWARLSDGTPLVTEAMRGRGRIVLFHVTANTDWSNLPLSGLFVQMLDRLVRLSAGIGDPAGPGILAPAETLDAAGVLGPPPPSAQAVSAREIDHLPVSARHPPGFYGPVSDRRALNLGANLPPLAAAAPLRGAVLHPIEAPSRPRALGPWLVGAALGLLCLDLLLSLALRGLLPRGWLAGRRIAGTAALVALLLPTRVGAAESPALATHLAYVLTGDEAVDELSRSGLQGLSDYVNDRTAAVLAAPLGVVPGRDDLSFYPLLYWPITPAATTTPEMTAALNDYMAHGGILVIDTEGGPDGGPGSGAGFAPGVDRALRRAARLLSVPPLAPLTTAHVLTRSFYLLSDFPGRYDGAPVWVQQDQDRANDGVSPIVIGANDWVAAWAVDAEGGNPYAVLPGGARQRTLAYRFGVNLVMYALTGNYKGDQVHVPAILERLGQ